MLSVKLNTKQLTRLVIMISLIGSGCNSNAEFKEKGIKVKATVIERLKKTTRRKRGSSTNYYLKVNFFTEPEKQKVREKKKMDTATNKSRVDQILDKLTIEPNKNYLGDYSTAELPVNYDEFQHYSNGSSVWIYYLKAQPGICRLAEYVED